MARLFNLHAWRFPTLRRVRSACAVAAAAIALFILLTIGRDLRVSLRSGLFVSGACGAINIGSDTNGEGTVDADAGPVVFSYKRHYGDVEMAWRPYRMAGTWWNYLVIPVWQPLVLCGGVAILTHGYLLGLGRPRDGTRCGHCGYDLAGTAALVGQKTCPECGAVSKVV